MTKYQNIVIWIGAALILLNLVAQWQTIKFVLNKSGPTVPPTPLGTGSSGSSGGESIGSKIWHILVKQQGVPNKPAGNRHVQVI